MKKTSMILGFAALTLGIHLTAQAQFPFPGQQPAGFPGFGGFPGGPAPAGRPAPGNGPAPANGSAPANGPAAGPAPAGGMPR